MVFVSREAAGVASRDDETDPILGNATPLRPGPRLACAL